MSEKSGERIFLATLEWHHGGHETVDWRIVHASSIMEARRKVLKRLGELWGGETRVDGNTAHPIWGCPIVTLKSLQEMSLRDLLNVPVLNVK